MNWLMTLAAIQCFMAAAQFVTGFGVIKFLRFESYDLKIAAVMFQMTGNAFLIPHRGIGVISSARELQRYYFGMTVEAARILNLLPERMTFRAVAQSFKIRVCPCQFSRRNLPG
jgi:hypothetical protein